MMEWHGVNRFTEIHLTRKKDPAYNKVVFVHLR